MRVVTKPAGKWPAIGPGKAAALPDRRSFED
jgi:hypothetical protein